MNIEFTRFNVYLHAYKVDGLHNFLSNHRKEFINIYEEFNKKEFTGIFNEQIYNPQIITPLTNLLYRIVNEFYYVDKNWRDMTPMLYAQTNKDNTSIFHNHYEESSITSTLYLDPTNPDEGGELEFYLREENNPKVFPVKDYIYFFPSWVLHKPLPQTRSTPRFCINWGYECLKRPIHKLTADKW